MRQLRCIVVSHSAIVHSMGMTIPDIKERLRHADMHELEALERCLADDTRKGVHDALEVARRRIEAQMAEQARLDGLYAYEQQLADARGASLIVGLDEAGRGPLAGPLAVGAVILPREPHIDGLNDSKQLSPEARERLAAQIEGIALACAVQFVEPSYIDSHGMSAALRAGFGGALAQIEAAGFKPDIVLIDGNPLRLDPHEVNVVKGDAKCASIAAASILAKTRRDRLMCAYAEEYPEYHLDACKGYASPEHMEAIKKYGLTPIHRASFCKAFTQPTLF